MATDRWSSQTTLKFIQVFKSYECLWNQQLPTYRNKHAREIALQKVADEMNIVGFGVPEVKKKMRTLRSTYYQEKRKIQNSASAGNGTDCLYVPNIPWYKEMNSLLEDVDERRTSIENDVYDNYTINEAQETTINEDLDLHEGTSCGSEQVTFRHPQQAKSIFKAKKKKTEYDLEMREFMKACTNTLSTKERENDEFDIVGMSVAAKMRKMEARQQIFAESLLHKVMTKGLLGTLNEHVDIVDKPQ